MPIVNDTGKDYGNMKFTEGECNALINHRIAICQYIHDDIIPNMPHDSKIKIGFGGTHTAGYSSCPQYTLVIHSEPHKYYAERSCGIPERDISIGICRMFGYANDLESGYDSESPYTILPIVENWNTIKASINSQLRSLRKTNATIFNFTV